MIRLELAKAVNRGVIQDDPVFEVADADEAEGM